MGGSNKIALEPHFQAGKSVGGNGLRWHGVGSEVRGEESLTHIPLPPLCS